MDRRTTILAVVFGAIIVFALASSVVYPRWIEPLLTLDERIAAQRTVLDELEDGQTEVELARREYRQYLDRAGTLDPVSAENELRERLNRLVEKHGLEEVKTSGGHARMKELSKDAGDVRVMTLRVSATGTLASALGFIKDLLELPHVISLGGTEIKPVTSRKRQTEERVSVRVPMDVLVFTQQRILGGRVNEAELQRPEKVVRHEDRDYSEIWERTPFTPFEELAANAGQDRAVNEGVATSLRGTATGGHGDYTCAWTPPDGMDDPRSCQPKLDTVEPGVREYVLTVTDEHGDTAVDAVQITVRERVVEIEPEPPVEPDPDPAGANRFRDGRNMQLCMSLIRQEGDVRRDEIMVYNSRLKETAYFQTGDEFDGGQLVLVHPRGALVRRQVRDGEDDLFVYPIGAKLDEDIPAVDANEHPMLRAAAERIRNLQMDVPPEGPFDVAGVETGPPEPIEATVAEPGDVAAADAGDEASGSEQLEGPEKLDAPEERRDVDDPGKTPSAVERADDKAPAEEEKVVPAMDPEQAARVREALEQRRQEAAERLRKKRTAGSGERGSSRVKP